MSKLELAFRKELIKEMGGTWTPTIHVESHLNPGVPDLSYVMTKLGCETGWLELKALEDSKMVTIKVERGQHDWMAAHAHRVPAHFLILIGDWCFLVHGRQHRKLNATLHLDDEFLPLASSVLHRNQIRNILPSTLIANTNRGRNDQV